MSVIIPMEQICPQCGKPIRLSTIEPHATRDDVALHTFHCNRCVAVTVLVESDHEANADCVTEISYERTLERVSMVMAASGRGAS
jgi:hypothetical protein